MFNWRKAFTDMALTIIPALIISLFLVIVLLFGVAEILVRMGYQPTTMAFSVGGSLVMAVLVVTLVFVIDRKRGVR
jgi:hypothetical protein